MNITITLTATNGTVTATTSNGLTFTAKESGNFITNLDRKFKAARIVRDRYTATNGVMVAEAVAL